MRKLVCIFGVLTVLAGCSDPLANVPKINEVELQENTDQVDIMAAPSESADTRPLFARLLSKKPAPTVAPDLAEVQEDVAKEAEAAGASVNEATSDSVEAALAEAHTDAPSATTEKVAVEPVAKPRLFAFLKATPATPAPSAAAKAEALTAPEAANAEVIEASLPSEATNPTVSASKQRAAGKGLFSRKKAAKLTGPDATLVEPGIVLPFGQIARSCKTKRSQMGREVERSSDGKGKFRLYDSAPGSTAARAFFITGFDDGCPRQVTAALAVFGDVSNHEALRYGPASKGQSWSDTDKAYEKIKRQVCKVGKGKPCGAKQKTLERSTSFVTVYNSFVGAQTWRNILLHDGSVVAMN